eukprot:77867-Prymnesium_polylepis.1
MALPVIVVWEPAVAEKSRPPSRLLLTSSMVQLVTVTTLSETCIMPPSCAFVLLIVLPSVSATTLPALTCSAPP